MLAVAAMDPTVAIPQRVVDFASLEAQIRRFIGNIGGSNTMALPPMEKSKRKIVHELAMAFNLNSQSKGKGAARYTSLIKTTRTGTGINERKIYSILKRVGVTVSTRVPPDNGRGGGSHRPREGDIVGKVRSFVFIHRGHILTFVKAAPKIGESNVGFQMLAAMGWMEGEMIGASGGLEVPLTAVVKHTKLGLGAMRG